MAGYHFFSKSNNAIAAEAEYTLPKTTFKKIWGVDPTTFIKPCESHHTSKFFNLTEYYSTLEFMEKIIEDNRRDIWEKLKKRECFNDAMELLYDYLEDCSRLYTYNDIVEEIVLEMEKRNIKEVREARQRLAKAIDELDKCKKTGDLKLQKACERRIRMIRLSIEGYQEDADYYRRVIELKNPQINR